MELHSLDDTDTRGLLLSKRVSLTSDLTCFVEDYKGKFEGRSHLIRLVPVPQDSVQEFKQGFPQDTHNRDNFLPLHRLVCNVAFIAQIHFSRERHPLLNDKDSAFVFPFRNGEQSFKAIKVRTYYVSGGRKKCRVESSPFPYGLNGGERMVEIVR
ncbi:hypothetical protein KTR10_02645 [Candidatus Kaiserbacteria bacterium]|nr:hypothetical protein [Candidatus Kaiserbacteria bacterium]